MPEDLDLDSEKLKSLAEEAIRDTTRPCSATSIPYGFVVTPDGRKAQLIISCETDPEEWAGWNLESEPNSIR